MRIVLIGKAGSGKDTVADYLMGAYGFIKYSFAAALKAEVADMWPEVYKINPRHLLQKYGAECRDKYGADYWIEKLFETIPFDEQFITITDCRYENEYDRCLAEGFVPVKIQCDDSIRSNRLWARDGRQMTPEELMHASEQLSVPCSHYLDNNGTFSQLYEQIEKLIGEVREVGRGEM